MRTRDWRRSKSESKFKSRIIKFSRNRFFRFKTANGDTIQSHKWCDEIGLSYINLYRNHSTDKWSSRNKAKYSPNKTKVFYNFPKKSGDSLGCREKDFQAFLKILKEYGLR